MAVKKVASRLDKDIDEPGKLDIKDPLPEIPPASKTELTLAHVNIHRPFYIWLPVALIFSVAFAKGYQFLVGRTPIDDIPMGAIWNVVLAVIVVVLTNNTKSRLFDDIDTRDIKLPWWRVVVDSCETVFLLLLFYFMVFR